ncbi:MAG: hypothetical protein KC646_16735 [Candidatus Cloacimonetes bacterium]|nr:hypothetical protein [Candidatus Cloacimonadota bacterium]
MLKIICFLVVSIISVNANENKPSFESINNIDLGVEKNEKIKLYGHTFLVEAFATEGTSIKWSDVKSYIPELLPDAETKKLSKAALVSLLKKKTLTDVKVFSKYVLDLSKEIVSYTPGEDAELVELELADYLVVNRSDILIDKFKKYDKSLVGQIEKAQVLHNKYILLVYLEKMVSKTK